MAISGGLLLIYGIGSVIGPSVAPFVMSQIGPSGLFAYTATVHAVLAIYAVYRIAVRDAPKETSDYVTIARPRSMNLILRADPRIIFRTKKTKR